MTILITGIHGFVGTNLVNALKVNHIIYGLDIVASSTEGVVNTFNWDELSKIPSVDVVIHLAGIAHDTKNSTNSDLYFQVNTGLTQKIYDWYLQSNATKFLFFSSVKSAADVVLTDILTEDVIPAPVGPYGESKIKAENYILSKVRLIDNQLQNIEINTDTYQRNIVGSTTRKYYILRPCMIHGPGNKGNMNLLYNFVKSGIPYPLGVFSNRRSFTSIDNLIFIINGLLESNVESGIYNVGDDDPLSTNEIIALMSIVLNKKLRIWKINRYLIQIFAALGTLFRLPFNNDRLQKLTENYVVSNKKIKHALGIDKMPVSAQDGFIKTFKSFNS